MKKNILGYTAPEVEIFEVAAECGYQASSFLPPYGSEEDEFYFG